MPLIKNIVKIVEELPTCRPILNKLQEIITSLKRNIPSAHSKDIKAQIADAQKPYNSTKLELDKPKPKHELDIYQGGGPNKLSFSQLEKDVIEKRKQKHKPDKPILDPKLVGNNPQSMIGKGMGGIGKIDIR